MSDTEETSAPRERQEAAERNPSVDGNGENIGSEDEYLSTPTMPSNEDQVTFTGSGHDPNTCLREDMALLKSQFTELKQENAEKFTNLELKIADLVGDRSQLTATNTSAPLGRPLQRYKMDHKRRGTALIINNEEFDKSTNRSGTKRDVDKLTGAFQKLGFEVVESSNLTGLEMLNKMVEHSIGNGKAPKADELHWDADCFVCIILSHGDNGVVTGVDELDVSVEQLVSPFKDDTSLAGKPKLFFIQACRGEKEDECTQVSKDCTKASEDTMKPGQGILIPLEADFLFAYATPPGYGANRHIVNGSWFIQSLCEVLNEHGSDMEIMSLLTLVNDKVAREYKEKDKKQIPCMVSTLRKALFFQPK